MKLAEALRIRKDYLSRLKQLESRINDNCSVQEGDEPAENPNELIEEYMNLSAELSNLICNINLSNTQIKFLFGNHEEPKSMTQALAERDQYIRNIEVVRNAAKKGVIKRDMYSRSEIKFVSTVTVKDYQRLVDNLAQHLRILDTKIQEQNWLSDLVTEIT